MPGDAQGGVSAKRFETPLVGGAVRFRRRDAVRKILIRAMADAGADPALVYAFQKTGVYICEENADRITMDRLMAFEAAIDEYVSALDQPIQ